jgi:hypothetical protein
MTTIPAHVAITEAAIGGKALLLPGRPGSRWRAEGCLPRRRRRPT